MFGLTKRDFRATLPMAIAGFLLLMGYEYTRPAVNSLYKGAFGAENLPIVMGLGVFGVLGAVWIYGRLLSAFGPRRTLLVTSIGSGILIALHYLLIKSGNQIATGSVYILKEAYIVLIIEQYWSFLNSSVERRQAKKLFGVVLGVATLGSIIGGLVSAEVVVSFGSESMLLLGAAATIFAGFVSDFCYLINGEPKYDVQEEKHNKDSLGLSLFKEHQGLRYIFCVILLTQVLSAVVSLKFHIQLERDLVDTVLQNQYESRFWASVNAACLGLNFVLAPLLMSLLSTRVLHLLIPFVHVGALIALILQPSLTTASLAFFLFKSIDYSLFRAAKEILYIPYSFDVRYRAKEVIDVFGYRFGKGGVSLLITAVQKTGLAVGPFYAWIALGAASLWFLLVPGMTSLSAKVEGDESRQSA